MIIFGEESIDENNIYKNVVLRLENVPENGKLELAMLFLFLLSTYLLYRNKLIEDEEDKYLKNNIEYEKNKLTREIDLKIKNEGLIIKLQNYLEYRSSKNIKLKSIIKPLSKIKMVYYEKYKEEKSAYLFEVLKYNQKKKILKIKINDFLLKKMNPRGYGHSEMNYPISIFECSNYRSKNENKKRFLEILEKSYRE